jgi:hypothetical protein
LREVKRKAEAEGPSFVKHRGERYTHRSGSWEDAEGQSVEEWLAQELDRIFRKTTPEGVAAKPSNKHDRGGVSSKEQEGVTIRHIKADRAYTKQRVSTKASSKAAGIAKQIAQRPLRNLE